MTVTPEVKAVRPRTGRRTYRVATPEGAEKYGQPIGTIITLDSAGKPVGKPKAPKPATTERNRPAATDSASGPRKRKPVPTPEEVVKRSIEGLYGIDWGVAVEDAQRRSDSDDAPTVLGLARDIMADQNDAEAPAEVLEALYEARNPTPAKQTPAQRRLEEVRDVLRANADEIEAGPDRRRKDEIVANLRALADDPDLIVGPPGTTVVGRKDDTGRTYTVVDMGTGMSLGVAATGLVKKADVVPLINRLTAAFANGDDDSGPLLGSPQTTERLKTWKSRGEGPGRIAVEVRAALDDEKRYTGTNAQEAMRNYRLMDEEKVRREAMEESLRAEGFTGQTGSEEGQTPLSSILPGTDVAYEYLVTGKAYGLVGLPPGFTGRVLVRGKVKGPGAVMDRHRNNFDEFKDGVRYPLEEGATWETLDGSQSGTVRFAPTMEYLSPVYLRVPTGGAPARGGEGEGETSRPEADTPEPARVKTDRDPWSLDPDTSAVDNGSVSWDDSIDGAVITPKPFWDTTDRNGDPVRIYSIYQNGGLITVEGLKVKKDGTTYSRGQVLSVKVPPGTQARLDAERDRQRGGETTPPPGETAADLLRLPPDDQAGLVGERVTLYGRTTGEPYEAVVLSWRAVEPGSPEAYENADADGVEPVAVMMFQRPGTDPAEGASGQRYLGPEDRVLLSGGDEDEVEGETPAPAPEIDTARGQRADGTWGTQADGTPITEPVHDVRAGEEWADPKDPSKRYRVSGVHHQTNAPRDGRPGNRGGVWYFSLRNGKPWGPVRVTSPERARERITASAPVDESDVTSPEVDLDEAALGALTDEQYGAREAALMRAMAEVRNKRSAQNVARRDAYARRWAALSAEYGRRNPPAPTDEDDEEVENREGMSPADLMRDIASGAAADGQTTNVGGMVDIVREMERTSGMTAGTGDDREDAARARAVTAAWSALDEMIEALLPRLSERDRDAATDLRDELRQRAWDMRYTDLPNREQRERRAALAARPEGDIAAMRAEYNAMRSHVTEEAEDYEAEFRRRGRGEDGALQDVEGADGVRMSLDLLPMFDSEEADEVADIGERYAQMIGDDAEDPSAGALAADLQDALDRLAEADTDEPERRDDAVRTIRDSIRPEHRIDGGGGEVEGQMGFDEVEPTPPIGERSRPSDLIPVPETTSSNEGTIYADGTPVVVYGDGVYQEGVAAGRVSTYGNVAVRYPDDSYDLLSPRVVSSREEFDAALHVVNAEGRIVAGGRGMTREKMQRVVDREGAGHRIVTGAEIRGVATPAPSPEPTPDPAPPTPPVEFLLEDATFADLREGDRILDDDRDAVVTEVAFADNGDAEIDVRYADGTTNTIIAPRGMYVQRITGEQAATLPHIEYTPDPIPADEPRGRVSISTSQRRVINEMALDSDVSQPKVVRDAAARLRNRQPLSAAEHRAMMSVLRQRAQDESLPARRRAMLDRVSGRFAIAADSAAISAEVRGTGRRRPPSARVARQVAVGDGVRIPATQGYGETQGRVTAIRKVGTMRVLTVRDENGREVERALLGGTYLEVAPGFGAEPIDDRPLVGDLDAGDRVDLGDGVPRVVVRSEPLAEGSGLVNLTVTGPDGQQETVPFGSAVRVSRLYGPEGPPPEEVEPEGPTETTPAGVVVGQVIVTRFTDTGTPFAFRVTSVTPTLGGSHYRITGYTESDEDRRLRAEGVDVSELRKQVSSTYRADEAVMVLPDPGEDRPIPTPGAQPEATPVGHAEIRAGDRILIKNKISGHVSTILVGSVEDAPGEDDDGRPLPGTRIYGSGFGSNSYSFFGNEKVERIESLGAEFAANAERNRRVERLSYPMYRAARESQEQALQQMRVALYQALQQPTSNMRGPDYVRFLRARREIIAADAVQNLGDTENGVVSSLLPGGATPAERMAMKDRLRGLHTEIAQRATDRFLEGFEESARDLSGQELLAMIDGLRQSRDDAHFDDYSDEISLLVGSSPAMSDLTEQPAVPADIEVAPGMSFVERVAAYRKAMPKTFGSRYVRRPTYSGDLSLDALRRGETPQVTLKDVAVADLAADGGPGAETMNHLETLKVAGRALQGEMDARVDRIMYGKNAAQVRTLLRERDEIAARRLALRRDLENAIIMEEVGAEGRVTDSDSLRNRIRDLRTLNPSERTDEQRDELTRLGNLSRERLGLNLTDPRLSAILAEQEAVNARISALTKDSDGLVISDEAFDALVRARMDISTQRAEQAEAVRDEWVKANTNYRDWDRLDAAYALETNKPGIARDMDNYRHLRELLAQAADAAAKDRTVKRLVKKEADAEEKVNEARKRKGDGRIAYRTARARAAFEVLSEVRELGAAEGATMQWRDKNGTASEGLAPVKALRWAEQHFPTDWLKNAGKIPLRVGTTSRGNYKQGREIMLSKDGAERVIGAGDRGRVAIHELGHHMEYTVPGLVAAENAWLWSRTTDEGTEIGSRTRTGEKNARVRMKGYSSDERARHDDLIEAYTGKEYSGTFFEVFTTGIESLFGGSPYIENDEIPPRRDEDHEAFMLGALALLGGSEAEETGPAPLGRSRF